MTRDERKELIKHLKYNRSIGADYLITDKDADEIIKALEQQTCEDCVSRQAAIDTYKNLRLPIYPLEELPPVMPEQKWIPVSERLPGKNGEYLITVEGKRMGRYIRYIRHVGFALNLYKVDKDYFADRKGVAGFYMYDGEFGYFEVMNVVAWMPLPEPYVPDTNIGKMSASPTGAERSDEEWANQHWL